jgi:hypothetical protein
MTIKNLKAVDTGVAGRTKGDKQPLTGQARAAVVDVETEARGLFLAADPTGMTVAIEHLASQPGEVVEVMPPGSIAGRAEAHCMDLGPATGATAGGGSSLVGWRQ